MRIIGKDRTVVGRDILRLEKLRDDGIARREQDVARRTDAGRRSRGEESCAPPVGLPRNLVQDT